MSKKTSLAFIVEKYVKSDPVTAAHSIETMDEKESLEVLKALPADTSAQIISQLPDWMIASLLPKLPQPAFKEIAQKMEVEQLGAVFLHVNSEVKETLLAHLNEKTKREIQEFLTYPEDSAGRVMSTDFIAFHHTLKVREAIQKIRLLAKQSRATSYAYVVDMENHLIGVMNMRDMLLAREDDVLEAVMRRDVFALDCFMDRETVANELLTRKYFAAPVVDYQRRLLGVIRADQLIDDVQEEASEDIQRMFGAGGDERVFSPVRFSLKKRLPWLHVNLATAFLAATVVSLFQDIIARIAVLAVYLPVVAGQGGNAGAQSLAVVMRGIVMREIPKNKARRLIFKETWIGLLNGLIIGVVTAAVAWVWQGNPYLGLVIGLGMVVNLTVAGFSGAAIPIVMKTIGLDPAQCSNIILTTITDVIGFLSFLGFAVLFQQYLV